MALANSVAANSNLFKSFATLSAPCQNKRCGSNLASRCTGDSFMGPAVLGTVQIDNDHYSRPHLYRWTVSLLPKQASLAIHCKQPYFRHSKPHCSESLMLPTTAGQWKELPPPVNTWHEHPPTHPSGPTVSCQLRYVLPISNGRGRCGAGSSCKAN